MQNLQNHTKWDPLFHFVLMPILIANFIIRCWELLNMLSISGTAVVNEFRMAWTVVLSIAFILIALKARMFALKAQDRIICLEERLRMSTLLPDALRARIGELTEGQLIALRFASDGELTELVRSAVDKKLARKEIKQSIREWRPDYFRL